MHIHTKVHIGGKMTDAGYEGGHTCHTGQLFFAEEAVLASAEVAPYNTSTTERTTLDEDPGAVEPWSRGAVEPWSRGAVEP
ncbi:hypothetical protein CFP59_04653 [Streptomyces malaysiensis subsp. malaysiensis]|nr:hypothetical protein CFP59_04653 [Streptomyces sp. M56]